ncbi:hypothetical protein B0H17DRAFT_1136098 [Mycena rosella]|uniref:Uncharacterized protein n=1 Tax=Mycena rosella TaxID=1033263 RepID=A0AAD7GH18_MYCRO|nr:hypothetical protein B0H17DRAFT_1136098 [Mycena rosella]
MNLNDATTESLLRLMTQVSITFLISRQGDKLFNAGQFAAAKAKYLKDARELVGAAFPLPSFSGGDSGGVISDVYIGLNPWERANMMGCCVGIARCLRRDNNIEMALAWCEEVNALYRCGYYGSPQPVYDWMDFLYNLPELTLMKSTALCLASDIFAELGNSGTATTRRWNAHKTSKNCAMNHQTRALHAVLDAPLRTKLLELRHPDPQATLGTGPCLTGLQVRGSWARLNVGRLGGVTDGRESFASFIWNSNLYVAGGRVSCHGPFHRDMWALDLNNPDAWRQLPDYPIPLHISGRFIGWSMLTHNDTALLFTGRPTIDLFDLANETWSSFDTTYSVTAADVRAGVVDGWPYPGRQLCDATMQIVDGKLYVFGGAHATTLMGCNLFMELDLTTRVWRRLSGYVRAPKDADYACPSPRKSAASWASPDKTRLYLLFGHFDREAPKPGELHRAGEAFGHEDFWSWSIKEARWRRERMAGNPPCARTELSYTYASFGNAKLGKAIVFGGYHPTLPTHVLTAGKEVQFNYSYFADTFIYDMDPQAASTNADAEPTLRAPKWRQVLTPGFPTYRCQGQLLCDGATGKTYLFGGWTNCQYIPTRTKMLSRSFGDVWELRVDVPGGHFEAVNVEEEARVARAGPWQRCFACAAAGPWKKCGGSCNGRVFFCGAPCLREGWKEHRELHHCRKT